MYYYDALVLSWTVVFDDAKESLGATESFEGKVGSGSLTLRIRIGLPVSPMPVLGVLDLGVLRRLNGKFNGYYYTVSRVPRAVQ